MAAESRCPVCQARFRDAVTCSRCGADLAPLMVLAVNAWRAREGARAAIASGDYTAAGEFAVRAQQWCFTERGERARLLAAVLSSIARVHPTNRGPSAEHGGF
jgi:predicted amidophosphoribosyltransferase